MRTRTPNSNKFFSTIERDRKAKWEAGAKEHGPIMNVDPLRELYKEHLDGINYLRALEADDTLSIPSQRRVNRMLRRTYRLAADCIRLAEAEAKFRTFQPRHIAFH